MIDKTKFSKGIEDKYSFENETFKHVAKNNPKDRIEVEVGDSKQPDFKPQVKVAGYTGRKHSDEAKAKMRAAKLGKSLPEEQKRKISEALKGRMPKNIKMLDNSGSKSHWWKGGITPENERVRKSTPYKKWRKAVFERDNYTCQECGTRSTAGNRIVLNADHILQFAFFPELRLALENGRTLCVDCHRKTPTWGKITNDQYATN